MLGSPSPQTDSSDKDQSLPVFIVTYGQHRIGVARAHDGDEAARIIAVLFTDELTHDRLKAQTATPGELAAYGNLVDGDEGTVAGVLL